MTIKTAGVFANLARSVAPESYAQLLFI